MKGRKRSSCSLWVHTIRFTEVGLLDLYRTLYKGLDTTPGTDARVRGISYTAADQLFSMRCPVEVSFDLALPDAVHWPPAELIAEPDQPFDLAAFFTPIPASENSAPLYLEALAEFDWDMAVCFPESQRAAVHERLVRRHEALAQILDPATGRVALWVNAETLDRVLDQYEAGFEKLRRAQERPKCAFELGRTFSAHVPHAKAAQQVLTIARLRNDRDLSRGEFSKPIATLEIAFRLARDLKTRASLICQITAIGLEIHIRELVLEIIRRPDLNLEHLDRLLVVLDRAEREALPHPLAEGHSVEYIYVRTSLHDLEHCTGDWSPQSIQKLGGAWGEIKTFGEFIVQCGKMFTAMIADDSDERTAEEIDEELSQMGPEDFQREVRHIIDYYSKLIAISRRPFQEQVSNFPRAEGFYLNLPGASHAKFPLIFTRPLAGLRMVRCLVAIRRWQLTDAAPPSDLEAVVRAAGMDAVPADPFGDGPIRMAWIAGEPVVYSVGSDGRDDGGRIDWNNGEQTGDFVLRLNPVPPQNATPPVPPRNQTVQLQTGEGIPTKSSPGSFKVLRLFQADVYVHWSWFLAAFILIRERPIQYSSLLWDVVGYMGGFGLVLLHEFGHVFACRQVGGTADRILMWPLGGLAFVVPPPRPVAFLWTTVAGPLINLLLAPLLIGLTWATMPGNFAEVNQDFFFLMREWAVFNLIMLVFNLLPIFPLDGGRILFAILWWCIGRALGLAIASAIGLVFGVGLLAIAVLNAEWWIVAMAAFLCYGAVSGLGAARKLAPLDRAPRRREYTCPGCGSHPPVGAFWNCPQCKATTDVFDPLQVCPRCKVLFLVVSCPECGQQRFGGEWISPPILEVDSQK